MATFKAVVQHHQQRNDGKFPVSIRVTNNRKSCYIPTGLYCSESQINKKTFEIKDQFVLARTAKMMYDMERKMLTIDSANMLAMDAKSLKKVLMSSPTEIDFIAKIHEMIASNPLKYRCLYNILAAIRDMGITHMNATDFNSSFLRKFKEFLDNKRIPITKNHIIIGYKQHSQNTKRQYLLCLCQVFRELQRDYNTEFNTVISHNPFINLNIYRNQQTAKRSMSAEQVRTFFDKSFKTYHQNEVRDMIKLSFCLCGVNLIDLLYMEKSVFDEETMRITYERHKTKDRSTNRSVVSVRIEPEIREIVDKYKAPNGSKYLFKFGKYIPGYAATEAICGCVKNMCSAQDIKVITPYWFRHTWATIARNDCNISKDDIDLCLGHAGSNPMADVYIKPDWSRVDRANRKVLDYVFGETKRTEE